LTFHQMLVMPSDYAGFDLDSQLALGLVTA